MGQAGAQREPTMEEILASIRRIIESNEPAVQPQADSEEDDAAEVEAVEASRADAGLSEAVRDVIRPASVPSAESAPAPQKPASVEAVPYASTSAMASAPAMIDTPTSASVAAPTPRAETPSTAATQPDGPVSLADVAARIRAESPRAPESAQSPAPAAVTVAMEADMRAALSADDDEDDGEIPPVLSDTRFDRAGGPEIATGLRVGGDDVFAAAKSAPADSTLAGVSTPVPASPSERAMTASFTTRSSEASVDDADLEAEIASSMPALLSADAGAKVAASFDHLSLAVAAEAARSFDEIAEDLLRPMLQTWLDDNLPTLVERLVREEIERVARGNRR